MNNNYPNGADTSDAPWNEKEVEITAYCTATAQYCLKKEIELECPTTAVISGCDVCYSISNVEWEYIYESKCMPPDELIRKMANALECFANPIKENPSWEYTNTLIGEANGWECDNDEYSFDVESEYCDY